MRGSSGNISVILDYQEFQPMVRNMPVRVKVKQ